MPAMGNIPVSTNSSGGTSTYTSMQAAGGDMSPAIWRDNSVGSSAGFRPEARVVARSNGPRTARRVDFSYSYPIVATATDGSQKVVSRINLSLTAVVPVEIPDTEVDKAVYQSTALIASTLVRTSIMQGFAPA